MDESGEKAYSTGGTLVRDFGQTFLEKKVVAQQILAVMHMAFWKKW